jgi:hypothetical protein
MNVWPVKNWLASLIATATSTVITRAIEKQLHCYGGKGFRDLFWKEIVRGDQKFSAGLPQKRDATFIEIALRRARALSIFASSTGLDTEALAGLIHDSLVSPAGEGWNLVAPAHDVLEDWSILRWLERLYLEVGQNLAEFQKNIGGHPALRRAYRKWMGELLERQPTVGEVVFREALKSQELETNFADDTLVALLQSVAAKALVESNEDDLLANDRKNLRRVIHLVRLACLTTPEWAQGHVGAFSLPNGTAWSALIGVVRRNWSKSESEPEKALLVLGLVEDWAKGVSLKEHYPEGAEDVAAITHELLDLFDGYSHEEELKRTIQILAKIPNADKKRYREILLTPRQIGRDRSRVAEELQEMLFSGPFYESMPTARDCSVALISSLRSHLICTEEDLRNELRWSSSLNTELYFGLRERVSHHYFPESAYRTPMLSILRQHPRKAIEFLIELFNHAANWYAHPRVTERLEPAFEVSITLPDGSAKTHWANERLWQLYRGTSVGPHVLQSYLMALERWLRDLARLQPDMFDSILVELLSRTDCASIAAVVAGVATAFPFQAGEAILCLLSAREYIVLDRARMVADFSPPSQVLGGMLNVSQQQLFRDERIVAPVDGIVNQRSAEVGARISQGQQLIVVVQIDSVWATANFKETQLKKMHVGQRVSISVDSLDESFEGQIENMPAATGDRSSLFPPENATGNYVKIVQRLPVRIRFNPNQRDLDKLRPGESVEPKVHLD